MARRELKLRGRLGPALLLLLSLSSCRHADRAPAPSASTSARGDDFTVHTRERHFAEELARARARGHIESELAGCTKAVTEKADLELCQAATSALAAITAEPTATPEMALKRLAPGALALVRLSERLRYLSLAELAQRHVEGDAGVPSAGSMSAASAATAPPAPSQLHKSRRLADRERHALELTEGPASQLLAVTARLEHQVIRNLGAYLEYGALPVRRAAFDTVKDLRATHPKWPLLERLLQEAALLESDADLKRDLRELSGSGPARAGLPAQSDETK